MRSLRPDTFVLWWLRLVCLWLCSQTSLAAGALQLDKPLLSPLSLHAHAEYYLAGKQNPGIGEILAVHDYHWKPAASMPPSISLAPRQVVWYRIATRNDSPADLHLILRNNNPAADKTEAFLRPVTSHVPMAIPPDAEPLSQYRGERHFLQLSLPAHSQHVLYVRVEGFHGTVTPLSLLSAENQERLDQRHQWFSGLTQGCLLGLLVYNLLLWRSTRQQMYLAYMCLGVFNLLTVSAHQGHLDGLVPDGYEEWHTNLSLVFPLMVSACLAWFFRSFIDTARHYPLTHLAIRSYEALTVSVAALFLLGTPMVVTTPVFFSASLLASVLMLRTIVRHDSYPVTLRSLLAGGFLMPLLSGVLTALAVKGSTAINRDYMLLMQGTDVLEMMFLSLAMASRVNQLQQAHKRQLDRAAEQEVTRLAQNRLLAHLNHEFRTPLNGIIAAAELLLGRSEKANGDTVNLIHQTALPLKLLIDELVNIDKLSGTPAGSVQTRFDLEKLLQECTDMFLPAAQKQRVRLFFTIAPGTPVDVNGDPFRIRQMLLNLLGNAFKFTREGMIGVQVYRAEQDLFVFEVFDTAPPVPAELRDRLFGRFEKGSHQPGQPGAGLGLSIVRDLSQSLGGDCGLRDQDPANPDAGKIFWFSVRLTPYLPIKRTNMACFEHRRVLVADPHPAFSRALADAIGERCSLVQHVQDARALSHQAMHTHFDIALVHSSLLDEHFDHATLEDILAICAYTDNHSGSTAPGLYACIARPTSIRKFLFLLSSQILSLESSRPSAAPHHKPTPPAILVVEDNATNQIILSEILKRFPVTVDICSNGVEAEKAFLAQANTANPYRLIFMDCEMPLQDGFETTRHIREHESRQGLRRTCITALTAHNEAGYLLRSREAGMDDFLSKPVSIDHVRQCLQRLGILP